MKHRQDGFSKESPDLQFGAFLDELVAGKFVNAERFGVEEEVGLAAERFHSRARSEREFEPSTQELRAIWEEVMQNHQVVSPSKAAIPLVQPLRTAPGSLAGARRLLSTGGTRIPLFTTLGVLVLIAGFIGFALTGGYGIRQSNGNSRVLIGAIASPQARPDSSECPAGQDLTKFPDATPSPTAASSQPRESFIPTYTAPAGLFDGPPADDSTVAAVTVTWRSFYACIDSRQMMNLTLLMSKQGLGFIFGKSDEATRSIAAYTDPTTGLRTVPPLLGVRELPDGRMASLFDLGALSSTSAVSYVIFVEENGKWLIDAFIVDVGLPDDQ